VIGRINITRLFLCHALAFQILTATRSGVIRIWNPANSTAVRQFNFVVENDAENASHQQYAGVGRLKGLEVLGRADDRRRALTIAENGDAFLFALPVDGSDDGQNAADDSASVLRFSVGSDTRAFHVEPVHQKQCVVGGKENDVALWDIETRQQTFKCKNVTWLYCCRTESALLRIFHSFRLYDIH
jgi:hypothetical protein